MSEDLDTKVLAAVENGEIADTWAWAASASVDHVTVVGTIKSLEVEAYTTSEPIHTEFWQLTDEAKDYIVKGSPEVQLFRRIPDGGVEESVLKAEMGDEMLKIAMGKCMKNKWISKDKASGKLLRQVRSLYRESVFCECLFTLLHRVPQVADVDKDELVEQLQQVEAGSITDAALLKTLKQRQLIVLV